MPYNLARPNIIRGYCLTDPSFLHLHLFLNHFLWIHVCTNVINLVYNFKLKMWYVTLDYYLHVLSTIWSIKNVWDFQKAASVFLNHWSLWNVHLLSTTKISNSNTIAKKSNVLRNEQKYIIDHYNPSSGLQTGLLTPLMFCVLLQYSLKSTTKVFYVNFIYSQSCFQKSFCWRCLD